MDIRLFIRVVRRFRVLIGAGLVLAILLTLLAYFRVSPSGIATRQSIIYESDSTLFVTQPGFPWGRAKVTPQDPGPDPGRFGNLGVVYSQLANSDRVRTLVDAPVGDTFKAVPVPAEGGGVLPFIEMQGMSPDPQRAEQIAAVASAALQRYIDDQQQTNDIPDEDRVVLQVIAEPTPARVAVRPSITRPLFVFVLCMTIVLGLAFVLENLRPRMVPTPVTVAQPPGRGQPERAVGHIR